MENKNRKRVVKKVEPTQKKFNKTEVKMPITGKVYVENEPVVEEMTVNPIEVIAKPKPKHRPRRKSNGNSKPKVVAEPIVTVQFPEEVIMRDSDIELAVNNFGKVLEEMIEATKKDLPIVEAKKKASFWKRLFSKWLK